MLQAVHGVRRGYVTPSRPSPADQLATVSGVERDGPLSNDQLLERVFDQKEVTRSANRPIYMDAQSTTPVDPRVLDAMMPYYVEQYGNPHSRTHAYGWETESATSEARNHVAELIGADSKEIIFTSGATESNNMILKGVANFYRAKKIISLPRKLSTSVFLTLVEICRSKGLKLLICPCSRTAKSIWTCFVKSFVQRPVLYLSCP